MGLQNISYKIDRSLSNYHGATSLKIYAIKTESEDDDLTTYTIQPIKSQIKLFAWLQEHFQFFNNIVTWWLTRSIKKDQNCYIFQDVKVYPKSKNDNFLEGLIDEIAQNEFFGEPDEAELREKLTEEYDSESADANWERFSFGLGSNAYKIRISLSDVRKIPEKVLYAFYEKCYLQSPHMQTVEIKALEENQGESVAVDAGGLRRQFITNLFNGLAKKTHDGNASYLAASSHSTGGWLPVNSKKCRPEEEESLYVAIGKFMGMCLTSQGSLVIGQIFNPAIFDVISQIPPCLLTKNYQDLDNDTKIALFNALKYRDGLQMPDEDILDYALENDSLPLIFKIAQGIAGHLWEQDDWADHENNMSAWDLDSQIQGLFNKELVKGALREFHGNDGKIKGFFHRWIDETDEDLVKKFVEATTGSTTIGATETIYLAITGDTKSLPSYHTCARQVDIGNFNNYETFKEKLEKSLEHCDLNGFQMI